MLPIATHPLLDGFVFQSGPPTRHEQLFRFIHDAVASGVVAVTPGGKKPCCGLIACDSFGEASEAKRLSIRCGVGPPTAKDVFCA